MSLLAIAEKLRKDLDGPWFPFQLILNCKLWVGIHGIDTRRIRGLFPIPRKHDGWCFQIKGKYKAQKAAEALHDACNSEIPLHVGLNAAAKEWFDATLV